jgi:hypothetical protein
MIQTTFPERGVMAELMAKMLWEIGAVHFSADNPYKLSLIRASVRRSWILPPRR